MRSRSPFPTMLGVRLGAAVLAAACVSGSGSGSQTGDALGSRTPNIRRLEARLRMKETRQDLDRLRTLSDEIASRVAAGAPLDFETVSKDVGEINKRARRLKSRYIRGKNRPDQNAATAVDAGRMPLALAVLCERIDSFLARPVFDPKAVIDVRQASSAANDLEAIVVLSATIRREAERLTRAAR